MNSPPTPDPAYKPAWPEYKEVGADFIGEVLDGRYQVVRRIAKGGMAHVFLGKDQTRKCYVAIKLLRACGPEVTRRFAVEAEVLSNIQHANIVRAVGFGQTLDAQPYMALEYLEGETLSQRLARGPLPWRDAAEIGVEIAGALHALHVAGVVHRDIKPDNIMLASGADQPVAKVIDLGLASVGAPFREAQDARFTPQPDRHKTQLGRVLGTPDYLPPEAGYCEASPRLDVYSLGATLYQLCTQFLPTLTAARPIHEVCPGSDAPEDLSQLLRSALAFDPADRLPSADHLRRGLLAILAAHPRTPEPRHLFGGSYDRLEVIGVGASAVVFRASDRELSREVALKVLRYADRSEDDAIRFRRAAKILSALRHPCIPRILHFGVDAGQAFAVTELCTGSPATNFVTPERHLRPDEAIAVGLQLASALSAVHEVGVIYRDLHPGNVLIARGESPKAWLFDFDQAQVSPEFYARLTERWAPPPEERPSPANERPLRNMDYAAPEVRAGALYTTASDVYALGLLLFRLLTGLRPFPPRGGEATPARKVCPACPPGLERLLLVMLNPGPHTRPGLAEVQRVLEDEQAELAADSEAEDETDEAETGGRDMVDAVDMVRAETAAASEPERPLPDEVSASTSRVSSRATADQPAPHADARHENVRQPAVSAAPPATPRSRARSVLALMLAALAGGVIGGGIMARSDLPPSQDLAQMIDVPAPPEPVVAPTSASDATVQARAASEPQAPVSSPVARPAEAESRDGSLSQAPPRVRRREVVTAAEATAAVKRSMASLRACEGAPEFVTVDLDIKRGRGVVTALNSRPPAPDDPRYAWHACVRKALERVRFPVSETAGHVRFRLSLGPEGDAG
ncbi:serine/threonine-protein kinase [Nannocystis punicea]|uniref:Serine/threonine-protein kinase n=1 Tax=Nannocystis punicea TaxID=2995304 RepID=A0ABY7HAW8_9BACT|nr:serine/threonine-protein kinase [Nannocystis poenicansa]WAS96403.1 serine/threonine-protein kinase [Nannocystis poenicansa]